MAPRPARIRHLGRADYAPVYAAMQDYTQQRDAASLDEFWVVEHPPVYTQGLAGKPEHILDPGATPVVQTDRGGQVTWHGPGQVVIYVLIDLTRRQLGVRALVRALEAGIVRCLARYGIAAAGREDAPGVYVGARKIASLGLRVRRGASYHGIALNVACDLDAFRRINPCGHAGLEVTRLADLGGPADPARVAGELLADLLSALDYTALGPDLHGLP